MTTTTTTGTDQDDILSGDKPDSAGLVVYDDIIYGLGGDDIIDAGRGDDAVYGGTGDDLLYCHNAIAPPGGIGGTPPDSGAGLLFGEAGDDTFVVYSQGGTLDGGDGSDTVIIAPAAALYITAVLGSTGQVSAHQAPGSIDDPFLLNATLFSVENIVGSGFDETFTGSDDANRMDGAAGNDVLSGGNGDDVLLPGIGVDIVAGGDGNDTVDFSGRVGVVASLAVEGQQVLDTSAGFVVEAFTLTSIENMRGTAFVDTLTGSAGDNRIDGGGGNDTMTGNGGHDVFGFDWTGQGDDTITDFSVADDRFRLDLATFTDVREQGGDTILTYSGGTITVKGVTGLDLFAWRALIVDQTVRLGDGNDSRVGTSGRDAIEGHGGDDVIDGGKGDDMLFGEANAYYYVNGAVTPFGNDTLYGGKGDDLLVGGRGDDHLYGGDGDDLLVTTDFYNGAHAFGSQGFGGAVADVDGGNDVLDGGAGNDRAVIAFNGRTQGVSLDHSGNAAFAQIYSGGVAAGSIVGIENVQLIGGEGADRFVAGTNPNGDVFFGGGGDDVFIASAGSEWFMGGDGNDTISYERSGVGVTIDLVAAANAADTHGSGFDRIQQVEIVIGTRFADSLTGDGGANQLEGGDGNDVLDGGAGNDRLIGGLGDDIFYVDATGDVVVEAANAGNDRVIATASTALSDNIETLVLAGSGAINGTGNVLDNLITGNAGANVIDGGGGTDRLDGGLGDDTYKVDRQGDLVFENANEGTDTVISTASFYLYANVENLTLAAGAGNIFGVGNELANTITGNESANTLLAGAGADTVHGGAGIDIVYGEAGNDQLFGDADNDFLAGGDGDDVIDGGTGGDSLYGEAGNDTLTGGSDFVFDQLVGGAGNDILHGDSGLSDYDYLYGNTGDDSFYVDTGDDLTFEQAGEGTDTVYANVPGANNGVYLYANIENLVLLGTTRFGVGNELANQITGNAVTNLLLGGDGNDIINGRGGNDVLFGQGGADTFVFEHGTGGDVIGDFVAGTDKIDLKAIGYTWAQVQNSMHQNGSDLAIDLGNGDLIVLQGVNASQLHQTDFILAGGASATAPVGAVIHALAGFGPGHAVVDALW